MNDDDAWFVAKSHGYGAGWPIRWQGWVTLAVYLLIVGAASITLAEANPVAFYATLFTATAVLIAVGAARTRGGWRWRWGERD